ncbi:hypothetical protein [Sansalvadorimonas verongulae]|uniref:hypothetical protein n=1 Tax=Sansalvadorimonas verongulae TaxID=2172824 RepID=UPI0012BCC2B1|nr:hypothetical protein [Sansalvadorimonas verongulae]MTI12061.1 hypothetical protein [Sansalvadorimonas verongulae]
MNLNQKSRSLSFFLTFFLGPLGLLYSHIVGAIILIVIAIVTAPSIIGPIICWVLSIAIGDHCTHKHNKALEEFKNLMSNKPS